MATIGEQITAARKAKGMTQDALAEKMNMSRQGISHWETGRTLPDAEALLRLSEALQYNFQSGEAITPGETAEQTAASENSIAAKAKTRRNLLLWSLAALAVIAAACLLILPRLTSGKETVYYRSDGSPVSISDYKTISPRQEGKAYLSVTPSLSIQNEVSGYFMYSFLLREENGIPFSIEQTECIQFFADTCGAQVFTAEELRNYELEPNLPAYGTFVFEGGQPARNRSGGVNGIGVGFKATGTDANGEKLTFIGYLPIPQD